MKPLDDLVRALVREEMQRLIGELAHADEKTAPAITDIDRARAKAALKKLGLPTKH